MASKNSVGSTKSLSHLVVRGDCIEVLKTLATGSFDSAVCDPPYSLSFQGNAWDKFRSPKDFQKWCRLWASEVLRVLKPGAYLIAAGSDKKYHRLCSGIEDAGFTIRGSIPWIYGQGMPHGLSLNEEWHTALRPSHEPFVIAQAPLDKNVSSNFLKHMIGGYNIASAGMKNMDDSGNTLPDGRWPPNVIFSHNASCTVVSYGRIKAPVKNVFTDGAKPFGGGAGHEYKTIKTHEYEVVPIFSCHEHCPVATLERQHPGASQMFPTFDFAPEFIYSKKPGTQERDLGMDNIEASERHEIVGRKKGSAGSKHPSAGAGRDTGSSVPRKNSHPTVKPIQVMLWLQQLVTPVGGTTLDPFAGSGTAGISAVIGGFGYYGIEYKKKYVRWAKERISWAQDNRKQLLVATSNSRFDVKMLPKEANGIRTIFGAKSIKK